MTLGAATAALQVDVLTTAGVPPILVDRWRDLAVASGNPFVLPEWHTAWCATHPSDAPFVLVCREPGGRLVGVVPLVRRGRRLLTAGGDLADWTGPACAPADEARVAEAVVRALGATGEAWSSWDLERCRTGGAWITGVRRASAGSALKVLAARGDDALVTVDLERHGSELTTGKKRRELDRLSRRLQQEHDVVVRTSDGAEEVDRDLAALLRLREARWDGGFDATARSFLGTLSASLARGGMLRLWVLEVDGEPAAVLLCWRLGSRTCAYSQAFDQRHHRHAVGMALLAHAARAAEAEGCTTFDLLRGDERHKTSFPIAIEALGSHRAVRRGSLARLETEVWALVERRWAGLGPRQRKLLRLGRSAGRRVVALRPARAPGR